MEAVTDFMFLGPKILVDGDCSHEMKRHFLHGKIAMTILDSILKSRDITLSTKFHIVKATVFPVVTYRYERWTKRRLCARELMLLTCGAGEDCESPLDSKEIKLVNPKGDQS